MYIFVCPTQIFDVSRNEGGNDNSNGGVDADKRFGGTNGVVLAEDDQLRE